MHGAPTILNPVDAQQVSQNTKLGIYHPLSKEIKCGVLFLNFKFEKIQQLIGGNS